MVYCKDLQFKLTSNNELTPDINSLESHDEITALKR